MTNEELKELASQLGKPQGAKGIETGEMLNETNIGMTLNAVKNLNLAPSDTLLELGHGNCGHLSRLLSENKDLSYFGLEISELMLQEAKRINQTFLEKNKVTFTLYDGTEIPFPDNSFDKVFTVNTLYFWENPLAFLLEIHRVMKPKGVIAITFGNKKFMEQLPFTPFGFTLYNIEDLESLVAQTPFRIAHIDSETERVKSKTGEWVDRQFHTAVVEK